MNDLRILVSSLNRRDITLANISIPPYIQLEVFQDSANLAVTYNSLDIRDITKRKTNFTKTIVLPGTKINNDFFESAFDVNVNLEYFNPRVSRQVVVLVGDNEILRGKLQLTNIVVNNKEVQYECTIFGNLKTLYDEIRDTELNQIVNASELNHQRTAENILYNITNYGGLLDDSLNLIPNSEYVYYPKIEYGRLDNVYYSSDERVFQPYEYNPALSAKYVWDKIFEFAGLTYTSDFLESDEFKKLALPYIGEGLKYNPIEFNTRISTIGLDENVPGNKSTALLSHRWTTNRTLVDTYTLNNIDRTAGAIDDPVSGEAIQFRDDEGNWDVNTTTTNGNFAQRSVFTAARAADYSFDILLPIFAQYFNSGNNVELRDGYIEYQWQVRKRTTTGVDTLLVRSENFNNSSDPWLEVIPSTGVYPTGYEDKGNQGFVIETGVSNVRLAEGDEVYMRIIMNNNRADRFGGNDGIRWRTNGGTRSVTVALRIYDLDVNVGVANFDGRPASSNVLATYDDEINMNQTLPKMRSSDFVLDIVKMFNLVIVDDKYNENNLIIEPLDDYNSQFKIVEDWCLDEDSPVEIQPFSDIDFNQYEYSYAEDTDYLNSDYNDNFGNGLTYGSRIQYLDNDFSSNSSKLQLKYAPTPTLGPSKGLFSEEPIFAIFDGVTNIYKPKTVKPRFVYINQVTTIGSGPSRYGIENENGSAVLIDDVLEASMVYNDGSSTYVSLEFAPSTKYYSDFRNSIFPINLYDRFHKNTFEELANLNSKILTGYFRLTPRQVNDFEFSDVIFLKGQYWRVNKIMDYNPNGRDTLTKVELIKVGDDKVLYSDYDVQEANGLETPQLCDPTLFESNQIGSIYIVSRKDGKPVSRECCRYLTGFNTTSGGLCISGAPLRELSGIGDNPLVNDSTLPVAEAKNPSRIDANNVISLGNQNKIGFGSSSINVIGDDIYVPSGVKNTIVIGDNIVADINNNIFIDDVRIDGQGQVYRTVTNIIDAGEDIIFPYDKINEIDIIDGGVNSVRNFGGHKQHIIFVDGNNKI